MKTKVYSVTEFGCISPESSGFLAESLQQVIMPDNEFDVLCKYIETQLTDETVEDKVFRIFYKKHQKVVKALNQVGVIQFANGLQIEILPKIMVKADGGEREVLRQLLLKLLSHVKDYPYLIAGEAQLSSKKDYPILEVFISSYIKELNKICMNGLKNSYEQVCDNLTVLKGKLIVPENIKKNSFSQNKFYCQYQRYTPNNAVNRIIKATLRKLLITSKTFQNRDKIYRLLEVFSQVESNGYLQADLNRTLYLDRTYREYPKVMMWSRLFLKNTSITSTQGEVVNTSIMFPMERVFEDYIAFLFKKYSKDYIITPQDRSVFLVTHRNRGKFRLKPDILVSNAEDTPVLIVDTKWKLLDAYKERENYGISQSDMYQLYAYGKKYEIEHNKGRKQKIKPPHLVLLYPENQSFKKKLDNFIYEGDLKLDVIPFSFEQGREEEQVQSIINLIANETQKMDAVRVEDEIVNGKSPIFISIDDFKKKKEKSGFIPLYSLRAACGYFDNPETPEPEGWIDATGNGFSPDPQRHFAVHAKGDSMEPKIKDGDICVFEWYQERGGSRNGEIVLTRCNDYDPDYDGKFTIKRYYSEKTGDENGDWEHTKIQLQSLNPDYASIDLNPNEADQYRTIGILKAVL